MLYYWFVRMWCFFFQPANDVLHFTDPIWTGAVESTPDQCSTNKQGRRTMEDKSWCNTWGSWEAWCWWWASACSFEVWRCISGSVFDAKIRFGILTWEFCGKLQSVLWLLTVVVVFSLISCSIKMFLHHLSSLKLTMIKYASWTFGLFAH